MKLGTGEWRDLKWAMGMAMGEKKAECANSVNRGRRTTNNEEREGGRTGMKMVGDERQRQTDRQRETEGGECWLLFVHPNKRGDRTRQHRMENEESNGYEMEVTAKQGR